jgi:hypothetical protein
MGGNKGGSRTSVEERREYDPVAAQSMADTAAKQYRMAEQQWNMYKEYFMPYEIEAAQADRELLPLITEASKTTLGLQIPVTKEFYRQSLEGIDVGERVERAGTEVVSAMKLGESMRRREMSRYGIDPTSSTYADWANKAALSTATGVAGARTATRTQAEAEKYGRLSHSLGRGVYQTKVGTADPYSRAAGSYAGAASSYAQLANRILGTRGRTRERDYLTPLGAAGQVGMGILQAGAMGAGAYYGTGGGN